MNALESLLGPWLIARGAKQRLAAQADMTPSGFGRGLRAGTLDVANLLRLAHALGIEPGRMLRAGQKADFADMIERMYGHAEAPLSPETTRVLEDYQQALPTTREAVRAVLRACAAARRPPSLSEPARQDARR